MHSSSFFLMFNLMNRNLTSFDVCISTCGFAMVNISIDESYWLATQNRRKFLKDFALASSFDPLVASNWYLVSKTAILATKVCSLYFDFII